jgi:hypothetical protein
MAPVGLEAAQEPTQDEAQVVHVALADAAQAVHVARPCRLRRQTDEALDEHMDTPALVL